MRNIQRLIRILMIAAVVLVALLLRLRAVQMLPIDFDEDDYMRAAQQFATAIDNGNWAAFTQLNYRPEHPPLSKIVNGFAISSLPPAPLVPDKPTSAPPANSLPEPQFTVARVTEAAEGVLQVLVLALLNPLAALLLAVNTWQIKYTTQVMIEALPSLTSLVAAIAFVKSKSRWNGWLVLSAVALGLTAASKFTYCMVGVAIAVYWLWLQPRLHEDKYARFAGWALIALVVFFAADPYLWPDPINRLKDALLYHVDYSQGEQVQQSGLPMWQPFVWLFESVPWHPGVFLISLDPLVTLFAFLGFRTLWQRQKVYALWLVLDLGFLLLWPTKWSQYILTLTAPLSIAAAEGLRTQVWEPLVDLLRRVRTEGIHFKRPQISWQDTRRALPWLLPGAITLTVITLYPLLFQTAVATTDLSTISLRDGLNGGVWRAVWTGLTGQAQPVHVGLDDNGRVSLEVQIQDRGEPRLVPIGDTSLSTKDVHFTGLDWFAQVVNGIGPSLMAFELIWTTSAVSLQALLGLAVALMLNRRGVRLKGFWQAIFILPWAIPEFVGVMVWAHVFEPTNGWLSLALQQPVPWNENSLAALGVLLISALWLGWPFMMLAASAGLKSLPPEVYDAAAVDGAGPWDQFRFITWPMLLPLLAPALIIRATFTFNQFYLFYVMRPPWPLYTLSTFSFFLLNSNTRQGGQYAFSAAINLFTVVALVVLLIWLNRRSRVAEGVTYA